MKSYMKKDASVGIYQVLHSLKKNDDYKYFPEIDSKASRIIYTL